MLKRQTNRRWLILLAILAIPMLAAAAVPDIAQEFAEDVWDYNDNQKIIHDVEEDMIVMNDELEILKGRCKIKETILNELISENITLDEAGKQFLDFDRNRPTTYVFYHLDHPEAETDEEASQIVVLKHLKAKLQHDAEMNCILDKLTSVYAKKFGHDPDLSK
jgi:hypothetical protein